MEDFIINCYGHVYKVKAIKNIDYNYNYNYDK